MHSYTLSNWDGSQSQKQTSTVETEKLNDKRPNTLSHHRDGSIFPYTQSSERVSNGERAIDATNSTVSVEIQARTQVEGVRSRGTTLVNGHRIPRETSIRRIEPSNQYSSDLDTLMLGVAQTSSSNANVTRFPVLANSHVQDQVESKSARSHLDPAGAISGHATRISTSSSSEKVLAVPRETQTSSVYSKTTFTQNHLDFNRPASQVQHLTEPPKKPIFSHPENLAQTFNRAFSSQSLAPQPPVSFIQDVHPEGKNTPAATSSLQSLPDPLVSTPISYIDPGSDYTSADADGESIDDLDIETLEPSPFANQTQIITASPSANLISSSQNTLGHADDNSKSVYDLFTPPPTRSPSQISHPPNHQNPTKVKLFQKVWVEIPPLPPGKSKADYRSWEGPNRIHTTKKRRRHKPEDDDADYEVAEQQRRRREREREQRQREEREKYLMTQSHPTPSTSKSTSTAYTAYQQEKYLKKSVLSNLSMRHPKVKSPKDVPSIEGITPGKGDLASTSASRPPTPAPFTPSSRSHQRIKSSTGISLKSRLASPTELRVDDSHPTASLNTSHVQDLPVQDVEHTCAAAVYFNTRFAQSALGTRPAEWTRLGTTAETDCVRPPRFFWDSDEASEDEWKEGAEGERGNSAGGALRWKGCIFSIDESSSLPSISKGEGKRASTSTGSPESGKKRSFARFTSTRSSLSVASPPPTKVPKVAPTRPYKSQKAASWKAQRGVDKGVSTAHREHLSGLPGLGVTATSTSTLEEKAGSQSVPAVFPQQEAPHHLSEKARGKQKAVDPAPFDTPSQTPPTVIQSPTSSITLPHSPTSATTSFQPINPHDAFEKNIGDYVVIDFSPENRGYIGGTGFASTSRFPITLSGLESLSSTTPKSPSNKNPFRSQSNMEDIFLVSHTLGSPVSSNVLDFGAGRYSLNDVSGTTFLDGEKSGQLTIDPAFLGGGPGRSDDVSQFDTMELEFEQGEVMGGEAISMDRGLRGSLSTSISDDAVSDSTTGYRLIVSSPIVTSSRRSSPRSTTPSLARMSQSRSESVSLPIVVDRQLSPEFPEYEPGGPLSQAHVSNARSSRIRSSPLSEPKPSRAKKLRANPLAINEDEDDEEEMEVQRGLVECSSNSDDDFVVSSSSKPPPQAHSPRRALAAPKRKPVKAKSLAVVPDAPKSSAPRTKQTAPRHKQQWPSGDEEAYCHQCRRKTRYLKMACPCNKKYCNRCIFLRYPEREFCLELDDFDCPCCRDECNCDHCTRKRGEDYISFRVTVAQAGNTLPPIPIGPGSLAATRTPSPSPVIDLSPLPSNVEDIAGPFTFWGSIYDHDGIKFADGFAGPGDKVVVANVVEGYARHLQGRIGPNNVEHVDEDEVPISRTFIGACQPSWRLGKSPIIKELGKRGRARRIPDDTEKQDSAGTRWFVGKERLLYLPVVAYTRNLQPSDPFSDLSSLSSLSSDDSDVEACPESVVPPVSETSPPKTERKPRTPCPGSTSDPATSYHTNTSINATDAIKDVDVSFDPDTIETKDTVRALTRALEACGMIVKIGDTCVNDS